MLTTHITLGKSKVLDNSTLNTTPVKLKGEVLEDVEQSVCLGNILDKQGVPTLVSRRERARQVSWWWFATSHLFVCWRVARRQCSMLVSPEDGSAQVAVPSCHKEIVEADQTCCLTQ